MPSSNVTVSATFVEDSGSGESGVGTFIFNTDEGLSALGIAKPDAGASTELGDAVYMSGSISMVATDGGTATRIWNSNGKTDLRIYKEGTLTFSGATITKIELAGATVNVFSANIGTITGGVWEGSSSEVVLTATGTGKINTITVTYGSPAPTYAITLVFGNETVSYNLPYGTNLQAMVDAYIAEHGNTYQSDCEVYTLTGWDKELPDFVTESATYTAKYTVEHRKYHITFVNWNYELLDEGDYICGSTPLYKGMEEGDYGPLTPTRPYSVEQIGDGDHSWIRYDYEFTTWTPAIQDVEGPNSPTIYKATYESKQTGTEFENVEEGKTYRKVLENGVLYIYFEDKKFDSTGKKVE